MSLVHNYGTWIGLRPRDRDLDADANAPSCRMSAMASGAAENAGRERAGHSGAWCQLRRGVKFSRPLLLKGLQTLRYVPREWGSQPGSDLSLRFPCRIRPRPW